MPRRMRARSGCGLQHGYAQQPVAGANHRRTTGAAVTHTHTHAIANANAGANHEHGGDAE